MNHNQLLLLLYLPEGEKREDLRLYSVGPRFLPFLLFCSVSYKIRKRHCPIRTYQNQNSRNWFQMIQTPVSLSHYGPISIEIQRIDIWTDNRGATGAARAPKPGKTPIMEARRHCHRHLLFFMIKVRPGSCRSYPIWRPRITFNHLRCHFSSTAVGTGHRKPTWRGTGETPHRHREKKNMINLKTICLTWALSIKKNNRDFL